MSRHQYRFSLKIWIGIFGITIIVLFIFPNSHTTDYYLNLLQNNIETALDNLPILSVQDCWYHQDGAPTRTSRVVCEYLSYRFSEK